MPSVVRGRRCQPGVTGLTPGTWHRESGESAGRRRLRDPGAHDRDRIAPRGHGGRRGARRHRRARPSGGHPLRRRRAGSGPAGGTRRRGVPPDRGRALGEPGADADRVRHGPTARRRARPGRRRLPAETVRLRRAGGADPGARPPVRDRRAADARGRRHHARPRPQGGDPGRAAPGSQPEGVRGPGVPPRRGRTGGIRGGAARTGLGRSGRPVHHRREDHGAPVAGQARLPAGDPHDPGSRLPDRGAVMRLPLRAQLTLLYAGPFFVSGAALLAVPLLDTRVSAPAGSAAPPDVTVHQPLVGSGVSLAVVAVVSLVLGWLIAGRFLRPLRMITATARDISASNLNRRLGLRGRDEFTDLADTLDDLFARLEASFESQRHFVTNASHELRTPLTAERALLQVALADPHATAETLRSTCRDVLALGETQERLIEALLTLATSERGIERREPFDLADIAGRTVQG